MNENLPSFLFFDFSEVLFVLDDVNYGHVIIFLVYDEYFHQKFNVLFFLMKIAIVRTTSNVSLTNGLSLDFSSKSTKSDLMLIGKVGS